jgi:dolichyl-phosphate beta-glucosyltransferase
MPKQNNTSQISIVVPAYNEEFRLPRTIQALKAYFTKSNQSFEVVIVVEKSNDQTFKVAREAIGLDCRFRIVNNSQHRGKGFAVRQGVLAARGSVIFFMDADLATDLTAINKFVKYFEEHPKTDVIIGSRAHLNTVIPKPQNLIRKNLGRGFNLLVQLMLLKDIEDTQCGFKAFRRSVAIDLFSLQSVEGFAFDVEILLLAQRLDYSIKEMPVTWSHCPGSKVGILSGSFSMFFELLNLSRRINRQSTEEILNRLEASRSSP